MYIFMVKQVILTQRAFIFQTLLLLLLLLVGECKWYMQLALKTRHVEREASLGSRQTNNHN